MLESGVRGSRTGGGETTSWEKQKRAIAPLELPVLVHPFPQPALIAIN
ncbi:hypothetical protein NG796_05040 [Laspinema sp. A4]|nr:hypothetical protein [Laspinema sp. D2d]MCT7982654.1 hypothetical protein [Laspinema sp. D2d]